MTDPLHTKISWLDLQARQDQHDRDFHPDIAFLPLTDRFRHLAFHQLKYGAQMIEAIESSDRKQFDRLLIDAFVIAISLANALGEVVQPDSENVRVERATAVGPKGTGMVALMPFVHSFIRKAGRFAKLGEALDHLESINFRREISEANSSLLAHIVEFLSGAGADIPGRFEARLSEVEKYCGRPWVLSERDLS